MDENEKAEQQEEGESKKTSLDDQPFITFRQFLEEFPLNTAQKISGYYKDEGTQYNRYQKLAPQIRLYCNGEMCEGYRRFDGRWSSPSELGGKDLSRDFLVYRCRDCVTGEKTFCILSMPYDNAGQGFAIKVGEFPELHIDLPSALPKLLGEEYRFFIKGLKCEKQGFGIAAFAYYRRVVENHKGRFLLQIANVAKRLGASPEVIASIEAAATEDQFSKAVDSVRDYIPSTLLIDGHNPMKLLHKALSIGLHASDDETCLQAAHSIRMVLQDLSQRIKDTLREDQGLKTAISALLQFKDKS